MNWSDIKKAVGKAAPMLGTLVAGPAGGAVGAMISSALGVENTPDAVFEEIQKNPEALLKLKEIEAKRQIDLQGLMVDHAKADMVARVQNASDINKTMQAESTSEHWAQWFWRPFIGMVFGFNLLVCTLTVTMIYIGVMFGVAEAITALASLPQMIGALGAVNGAALPVLGIASWHRGKQKLLREEKSMKAAA